MVVHQMVSIHSANMLKLEGPFNGTLDSFKTNMLCGS